MRSIIARLLLAMCRSRSKSTSGVKSSGCDGTANSQNLVRDAVGIKCCSQEASCKPAIAVRCATGRCFRECSNEHVAQSMHGVVRDRSSQRAFLCVKMMMIMVVVLVMMILTRALLLMPIAHLYLAGALFISCLLVDQTLNISGSSSMSRVIIRHNPMYDPQFLTSHWCPYSWFPCVLYIIVSGCSFAMC